MVFNAFDSSKESDLEVARTSSRRLAAYLTDVDGPLFVSSAAKDPIQLPRSAGAFLLQILTEMSAGNSITLVPLHAELTTQQAADLLGVSRPFIVKLIREKELPCRKVGTHRRVAVSDVMAYKRRVDDLRRSTLVKLAADAQSLQLGY